MFRTRVLTLLCLFVKVASPFSWDIVVAGEKQLSFYYSGTLTHTEEIPLVTRITSVTYDPVHYRVLFTDVNHPYMSISSFDISTRKTQSLLSTKKKGSYVRVVYDPVTELLIWKDDNYIYTFSLNYSSYKSVDGNLLLTLDHNCRDVTIDSCRGYIYWITDNEIERVRLDGSKREVVCVVDSTVNYQPCLAIDQQTQRMFWIERKISGEYIESSNFNGKNKTTLYVAERGFYPSSLAVSKDFIYWQNFNEMGTWQLSKNSSDHVAKKLNTISSLRDTSFQLVAANYTVQEQIQGIKSCESLQSLIPNNSKPESTVLICQNYCLKGVCSVNAEGQPTCSCKAGHSGERCEVNACHQYCLHNGVCSLNEEDEPVCQCTADYVDERCETSILCSAEEVAKFRSDTSNTGERKVNACHQYCLHNGVCSLNEQDKPACQCTADYEGERCEVSVNKDFYCKAACSVSAEGQPSVTVTLGNGVKSTCASNVV